MNRSHACADADELIPEEGKDEEYDNIVKEITTLETSLNKDLKKLEREVGCVCWVFRNLSPC